MSRRAGIFSAGCYESDPGDFFWRFRQTAITKARQFYLGELKLTCSSDQLPITQRQNCVYKFFEFWASLRGS